MIAGTAMMIMIRPNTGCMITSITVPTARTIGVERRNGRPNAKKRRSWDRSFTARESSWPDSQESWIATEVYWRRSNRRERQVTSQVETTGATIIRLAHIPTASARPMISTPKTGSHRALRSLCAIGPSMM